MCDKNLHSSLQFYKHGSSGFYLNLTQHIDPSEWKIYMYLHI